MNALPWTRLSSTAHAILRSLKLAGGACRSLGPHPRSLTSLQPVAEARDSPPPDVARARPDGRKTQPSVRPAFSVLVVADCPHAVPAAAALRAAMDDVGYAGEPIVTRVICTDEEAQAWGFLGSPTFLVNRQDVFPAPGQAPGLGCRLYRANDRVAGVPTPADLRAHLILAVHL